MFTFIYLIVMVMTSTIMAFDVSDNEYIGATAGDSLNAELSGLINLGHILLLAVLPRRSRMQIS